MVRPNRLPRDTMSTPRFLFVCLLLLGAGWVPAADIEWRGGSGDNFATVQNWQLPPDIPPDTKPEDREAFRRVPGENDRAIIGAGFQVTVSANAHIKAAQIAGDLEVRGQNVVFSVEDSSGASTDTFGSVFVRAGGQFNAGNRTDFAGKIVVEGGGMAVFKQATFNDAVELIGTPRGLPETRFAALAAESTLIDSGFRLTGPANSLVRLAGRFEFTHEDVTWNNCAVELDPAGPVTPGQITFSDASGNSPSDLVFDEGDAGTTWRIHEGGKLVFEAGSAMRLGSGQHAFNGRVEFKEGSRGIFGDELLDGEVLFTGGVVAFNAWRDGNRPGLLVEAQATFGGDAFVVFTTVDNEAKEFPGVRLGKLARDEFDATAQVTFTGQSKVEIYAPMTWISTVLSGGTRVLVFNDPDDESFGEIELGDEDGVGELDFESGSLEMPTVDTRLLVPEEFTLTFGSEAESTGFLFQPDFSGQLINLGTVEVVGGTNGFRRTLVSIEGLLKNSGEMFCQAGHGFSGLLWNAGAGSIEVEPNAAQPPDFPPYSPLGTQFINEGSVEAKPGAGIEVVEGATLPGSVLHLAERAIFRQVRQGVADVIVLPGGPTNVINRLFVVRAGASFTCGTDARLEIVGEGKYGRNFVGGSFVEELGGLRLEQALAVDQLVFGGGGGDQKPQIRFTPGTYPDGIGLRIRKLFAWFGGAFVGDGTGEGLSTANVELAAAALGSVTAPAENPFDGAGATLGGGITFDVRGGLTINRERPLTCEDNTSRFVFHPGADVNVQALLNQGGNNTARIVNRTLVRKTSTQPARFNGRWANEGEGALRVDEGEMLISRGTVSGANYQTAVTGAAFTLNEATLRDFTQTGGQLTAFRETRFEGNNSVDFLVIGNAISSEVVLTSAADSTLTVKKGMTWRSNGIQLGTNSRLVLEEAAQSIIASALTSSPAGRLESGKLENHGRLTYVADDQSAFQFDDAGSLENRGTVAVDTSKGIRLFQGNLAGRPGGFHFINRGLVLLAQIANGDKTVEMAAKYVQLDNAILKFQAEQPPQPQGTSPRPGRPLRHAPNPPNLGQVTFLDDVELSGGECDFSNRNVRFDDTVTMTGGKLIGGNNGEVLFNSTFNFNGGELRLESRTGPALGKFGRVTTIRNGRLFLDGGAILDALPGFNLRDGSLLSGFGRTTGGISVSDSTVSPGEEDRFGNVTVANALTVGTDISFNPSSRLILHVSVEKDAAFRDALLVGGIARPGGTLELVPLNTAATALLTQPVIGLDFQTREGDFANVVSPTFRGNLVLKNRFRDPGETDMVVEVVVDTGGGDRQANLALTGEVPLTAPTGSELTLTYTVENKGPDEAPSPKLEVTLPANAAFVSSVPAGTVEAGRLTVNLPSLAKDAKATVNLKLAAPAAAASLAATATVSSLRPDPALENNTTRSVTAVFPGGEFKVARFELDGAGKLKLTFETLSGVKYRLERSMDLETWTPVQEFPGDGTTLTVNDLGSSVGRTEFFRLAVVP